MSASGPRTILIVDDESSLRLSIKQALTADDRLIDLASSGEEALRLEAEHGYEVIISDLMMPGLSGLDLLRALNARGSRARIVLITGYPTIASAEQAVRMGAFGFLSKPFMPAEIRALVEDALDAAAEKIEPSSGRDVSG